MFDRHPQVKALRRALEDEKVRQIRLSGLQGSAMALVFANLNDNLDLDDNDNLDDDLNKTFIFILDDEEQAGYFYHDLVQVMGDKQVLFFPSSFRRAVKYGQRDAANEILRTEVLTRLSTKGANGGLLYIVTHPEAMAERVVSQKQLEAQTLTIREGENIGTDFVTETLMAFGFNRTDYVYEPGQFAVRGSLIDVFSYSCEYPFA